jgi:transcriptional regulator with XRE-family HTH domain
MVDLAARTTLESEKSSFTTEQMADLLGATPQQRIVLEFTRAWSSIPERQQQEEVFILTQALALRHRGAVDLNRHLGTRIRERRWMLGLTMEQMSELVGVSSSQVWKYETGINRISPGRLNQISQALGVDIGYFFEGLQSVDRPPMATAEARVLLELARNFSSIRRRKEREEVLAVTRTLAGHHNTRPDFRRSNPKTSRLAAPVRFVIKLMQLWEMADAEGAKLLGLEREADLRDLTSGAKQLDTRDVKDRVRHLIRMREALHSLFGNINAERGWLREPRPELDGQSPLDLLLEGSMENFLVVSQFVQWLAGR